MNNLAQVTIWGGAGEHGRSCYLIQNNHNRVLLDCGVKREEPEEYPLLAKNLISSLDAVFLSHAHEDHSMAIPLLYKWGYTGKIWTTRATALQFSAYIAAGKKKIEGETKIWPYSDQNIRDIQFSYIEDSTPPGKWLTLSPSLRICWGKSGHILGSIWFLLNLDGKTVFFSGDFTVESGLLSMDWPPSMLQFEPDLSIIDAAYGVDSEDQNCKLGQFKSKIQEVFQRGGSLLFPTPTFGRGQELLVWVEENVPAAQLLIEQELMDGLKEMLNWPQWLSAGTISRINRVLEDKHIVVIKDDDHRARVLSEKHHCIIFTSDGMMQSDKSQWYYHKMKSNVNNGVILTGHLGKGSFGDRLLRMPQAESGCEVQMMCYKVHQGINDVRNMLRKINSGRTIFVHAEKHASDAVCRTLSQEGFQKLYSLVPGNKLSF